MAISAKHGGRRRLSGRRRDTRRRLSGRSLVAKISILPIGQTFPLAHAATFLIANARLEFPATRSKQTTAVRSNRERIAVSQSVFSERATRRSLRQISNRNIRFTRFHSTCSKHTIKQNSNRNKNSIFAISASPARHRFLSPLLPPLLAAIRLTRYNSGSYIEVNQP